MDTMTTIESYERTPKGAHKITFIGGTVAGTKDDEIGALAERLAGEDNANPVQISVDTLPDGKLLIKSMQEITPPAELGGSEEPAPVVGEDVAKAEAIAPGSDPTGEAQQAEPTLDDVIVKGLEAFSDEALLAEVARRLAG